MDFFTLDDALLTEAFNEKEAASLLQTRRSLPADPVPGICAGLAARMRNAVLAGGRAHLPADRAWWAAIYGVTESRARLK